MGTCCTPQYFEVKHDLNFYFKFSYYFGLFAFIWIVFSVTGLFLIDESFTKESTICGSINSFLLRFAICSFALSFVNILLSISLSRLGRCFIGITFIVSFCLYVAIKLAQSYIVIVGILMLQKHKNEHDVCIPLYNHVFFYLIVLVSIMIIQALIGTFYLSSAGFYDALSDAFYLIDNRPRHKPADSYIT